MEIWKPVAGYDGLYEVSNAGKVRSLDRPKVLGLGRGQGAFQKGRQLKPCFVRGGYLAVSLSKKGVVRTKLVHHIVLEAFVGPRENGQETRHLNGDRSDNRLVNLKWGSRSENTQDQVRLGTHRNSVKTVCPRGHSLIEPNLSRVHQTRGQRVCKSCHLSRAYIQHHPEADMQQTSDIYYSRLMIGG